MGKNGGEAIAELLSNYGVKCVFGVPGGQTLSFYDAIQRLDPKIKHVLVRDEKSGPFMAIGYSKVTFRPGLCDGTAGPGAANMLPSVIEAFSSSTPIIVLTSNIVTKWMGWGASQELDHFALFDSFVKASLRPKNTHEIPNVIRSAFRLATSGRPGPVHVDLPQDILEGEESEKNPFDLSVENAYSHYPSYRPRPDPNQVLEILELIEKSSNPILFVGGGAMMSQASSEVQKLAELIGAPVVTTLTAKGIIPENHPLCLGCVGRQGHRPSANRALGEADLVIALGTKFAQVSTNNWTLIDEMKTRLVHVDIDPSELSKIYKEQVSIFADVKATLEELIQAIVSRSRKQASTRSDWMKRIERLQKEWASLFDKLSSDSSEPIKAAFVLKAIQKALLGKSVLVSSGSFSGAFAGCFYNVTGSGNISRFIQARGMAGTEPALPIAIGAALGVEDQSKVFAVTGDGGFGYHVAELETAKRVGISLPIVVMNNNSLAWMKLLQEEKFGSRFISSGYLPSLSYAKAAEVFGCKGIRIERASELAHAIADAVKSDEVTVLEVMTDPKDCSSTHMAGDMLAKEEGSSAY
ncbi:MAG: thiamine pyrophosphate-binding protein [archaeon]|nr:thiamine pyrophosphate-binding protein [archaeon]